ncbi:kinase-like domain-containing protein [Zopfochytrium polystomum]|nr:kinase-like domain-containing protein [Zopfochytrium polystomum]
MEDIASKMVPENILSNFMIKSMETYSDLWHIRKQFTLQMAAVSFMTFVLCIGHRYPQKMHIAMQSGNIWSSDMLPSLSSATFLITNTESIPFRLTPNIQHFITPIGLEGVFSGGLMAIARSLTEPEYELDDFLSIFIRDELITSQTASRKALMPDVQVRDLVYQNSDLIIKRAQALACKAEREKGAEAGQSCNQSILDLISHAGNPLKLAQMDPTFMASL